MRVLSCTTEEFPRPAPRPAYSVLGTEHDYPIVLPDWQEGLASYLTERAAIAMKMLVTGAAGFIGSTYVRVALEARPDAEIVVLDKLTYAGRRENLTDVEDRIEFVEGAIEDRDAVDRGDRGLRPRRQLRRRVARRPLDRRPGRVRACARDRHVGAARRRARAQGVERYLQVSTDEVYGSIEEGSFTETSPLDPSSPYSATKAAGDLLVSAHVHTYGIEAVICRGSNNYGPRQYPEKLIPLCVLNALHGDSLPVYGDGRQVRNWLYVEDFARAIDLALLEGPARRGLQRRRPERGGEHRRRPRDPRADRAATSR